MSEVITQRQELIDRLKEITTQYAFIKLRLSVGSPDNDRVHKLFDELCDRPDGKLSPDEILECIDAAMERLKQEAKGEVK